MDRKTYWEQAQEEEDREQEAYLTEYRKRKEAKKQICFLERFLSLFRKCPARKR